MKEIASLLMPNGLEHKVYAQRFVPDTPPEQTIVFPDKTQVAIDWRRNLKTLVETSKIIEAGEVVQEEGTYRVPFSNPEVPYAMGLLLSDSHLGSYTTDHQLVIDLIDTVLATPNSFLMDLGDTFNNGVWGGLSYEDLMPPYMQAFTVEDMMREVGDKWACTILGNHTDWMFEAVGQKPEQIFARKAKGPIFAGMGLLHLEVGKQKYDLALAHNYWGKSKINIHNCCVRLRENEYPDADVFAIGHEHIWGFMKEKVNDREVLYARPGTAKLRDRYARIHGIAKRGQGCGIAIIFGGDKREFNAYTIDDAADLMRLRQKVAV